MSMTLVAVVVSIFLVWNDTNFDGPENINEEGTAIYREIAGTYQQVGQVGAGGAHAGVCQS